MTTLDQQPPLPLNLPLQPSPPQVRRRPSRRVATVPATPAAPPPPSLAPEKSARLEALRKPRWLTWRNVLNLIAVNIICFVLYKFGPWALNAAGQGLVQRLVVGVVCTYAPLPYLCGPLESKPDRFGKCVVRPRGLSVQIPCNSEEPEQREADPASE